VHFWAGTIVLVLAVPRLIWRLWAGAPEEITGNPLLTFVSRAAHLALYFFIFAQPLLGILMVNAGGRPVTLAWVNLSFTLIGADSIARPLLRDAHEWLGNVFYWVIGLHALAAISSRGVQGPVVAADNLRPAVNVGMAGAHKFAWRLKRLH
jgi:cytochrome b561